jgi:diguanylate cyclase
MKSKYVKKTVSASQRLSLGNMLDQNKKIRANVKQSARELTSVNGVLKKGHKVIIPEETMNDAIAKNADVEIKVTKAADDLHQVNSELAREVAEREDIETELAEVRDELSKSKAKEEETLKLSLQDTLTGLPNRVLLEQIFEQGLIQAKRHGWGLAVLFIDIDNFKQFNDEYGHDLGDKILLMVANRLQASVRKEDRVCRWGGDEFVCLMLEVSREADVTRLAEKMVHRIAEVGEFKEIDLPISISIGISIFPVGGETAAILFKNADMAMYKAKGTKKKVFLFNESALD